MVSDKCCRLCLHDLNLELLSLENAKIDEIYKTVFDLFKIDIKETDFCRWICNTCYENTSKFKEYKLKVTECQKIIENYEFLSESIKSDEEPTTDKSITKSNCEATTSRKLKKDEFKGSRKLRSQKKESERLTRSSIKILKTNSTKIKNNIKSNNNLTNKNEIKLKDLINSGKRKLRNISIKLFKLENNDIDLKLLDEQQNQIEFNKLSYIEIEQLHESIILPEIWSSFLNCFQKGKINQSTKKKLKVILNKSEYEMLVN